MSVFPASTMASQHFPRVVSDVTDQIVHIRPEEINYSIYLSKYTHLTSEPDTARWNMTVIPYDSKSKADDLFWAAAVKLYEEKVKFLPKNEADLYVDLCMVMHIWYGHGADKVGNHRIHKELLGGSPPSFVHALILCLLYGWEATSTRKWFQKWERKYHCFHPMPHLVEGISDVRNHPEPQAGRRFKGRGGLGALNSQLQSNRNSIRLIEPTGAKRSRASAQNEPPREPTQNLIYSEPSPRTATQRARVPGFFDEREPDVDDDLPDALDAQELNRETQSGLQDSFTSGDQTADIIVMDEDVDAVIANPRKRVATFQDVSTSYMSQQREKEVTDDEIKYLHQKASSELVKIDQELKRVTKEIAQYESQVGHLHQELSELTDKYGKAKARVVHWEVAEMGPV